MEGQNVSIQEVNGATAALLARPASYEQGVDNPWKSVVGGGVCDLREAVAHTRADIRESIQNLSIQNTQQFAHVHEKACDAEKEAIRAQYEGKLQTIQTGKEVENRVSDAERRLDDRTDNFERNVQNRFCDVEKLVMREACDTRERMSDGFASVKANLAECCCEMKERFLELSREHTAQLLVEAKDKLLEQRFLSLEASLNVGNGNSVR